MIYQCTCGETIEFPDNLVGRLATCKSCNAIFTVPRPASEEELDEIDNLFEEPVGESEEPLIDMLVPPPDPPPPAPPPNKENDASEDSNDDEGDSEDDFLDDKSFWGDLVEAFEFIVHGRSLMTYISLTLLVYLSSFLTCVSMFGIVVWFLINGYLCAYCLSVIIQSAMGVDELPELSFDNFWDDVIDPFLRFVISWVCVLIPAFAMGLGYTAARLPMDWELFGILAIGGACFWPATILMVAIADGFSGLSPLLVLRTILSAPIPYVVVILGLVFAGGISIYVEKQLAPATWTPASWAVMLSTFFLGKMIHIYSMIVSMRIIGLYYRHYHRRFPWAA
jgi:hypothetical protein